MTELIKFFKYPGVTNVSKGLRIKDGKLTDEVCISIGVSEKKSLSELEDYERIPPETEFEGGIIKTDIRQYRPTFKVGADLFPPGSRTVDTSITLPFVSWASGSTTAVVDSSALTPTQTADITRSSQLRFAVTSVNFAGQGGFDVIYSTGYSDNGDGTANLTMDTAQTLGNLTSANITGLPIIFYTNVDEDGEFAPGISRAQTVGGPVVGGTEISNPFFNAEAFNNGDLSNVGGGEVGTLGFIAQDVETDAVVAVTNAHVAAGIALGRQYFEVDETASMPTNYNSKTSVDENITYPLARNTGSLNNVNVNTTGSIGRVWRTHQNEVADAGALASAPLTANIPSTNINSIDAAVVALDTGSFDTSSWNQLNLDGYNSGSNPPWETDTVTLNGLLGNRLIISGARTGAKGEDTYAGSQSDVHLVVTGVNGMTRIRTDETDLGVETVWFTDTMNFHAIDTSNGNLILPGCSNGGDSGSGIYGDFSVAQDLSDVRLVGLNYAGSWDADAGTAGDQSSGTFCRLDHVASLMRIKRWDGADTTTVNTGSAEEIIIDGYDTRQSVLYNGKRYYRSGTTSTEADVDINDVT